MIYNFANQSDHKKFPAKPIHASDSTFHFDKAPNIDLGIDSEKSAEAFLEDSKTVSFLVIRNDTILYEWYGKSYNDSAIVTTFSMAKSLVGLMIGIAIDEGAIVSEQDYIVQYLPELKNPGFDSIRIVHLLNMCSGIHFGESYVNPFGDVAKYYYGKNLKKYVSKMVVEETPGTRFNYQSGDTQLLAMILARATGKSPTEYLQEKIWDKLGMQYDASWSIDSKRHQMEKAFCCINARTVDLAKIGRLMLNRGNWEGEQIVSKEWVHKSTKGSDVTRSYSRQWWILQTKSKEYMAQGILGQFLYVNPSKNVVIVRMGKNYGDVYWKRKFKYIARNL